MPLRDDIARGDLRALYIGWLSAAWLDDMEEEGDDVPREPPVPPGFKTLFAPLRKLADFLDVDMDLLAVAAQRSEATEERPESFRERKEWLQRLPDSDKNLLMIQVMQGEGMEARARLLQRFRQDTVRTVVPAQPAGRTMGELFVAAAEHRQKRIQREKG